MDAQKTIFCDWVTVKQTHPPHKPLYGGIHKFTDLETGEVSKTYQFKTIKGKHDSSFQIRSDGETVEYSGNPSRFDMRDNVQGFTLDEAKNRINQQLKLLGIPEFNSGQIIRIEGGERINTGAKFTRIDMTQNLKAGNPRRRDIYLQWIQTQNYPKLRKTIIGLNTYFGKETESRTLRIYDKAKEITDKKNYPLQLADRLNRQGVIRFEMEYRKILKTRGVNLWKDATQTKLEKQFAEDTARMNKKIETLDITELPKRVVGTYTMYLQGINPREFIAENTYYKHKKILLEYGVDISNTVVRLIPKKEVIELEPVEIDTDQLDLLEG